MRVFLIGFMGCGKSLTASIVAEKMRMQFIDLDAIIVEKTGMPVVNIFEQKGEFEFRKIEAAVLEEQLQKDSFVMACGGGTPCFFDNHGKMKENGVTFFLDTPHDVLLSRLQREKQHRPLLKNLTDEMLGKFIEVNLERRKPFYTAASYTVNASKPANEVAEEIISKLQVLNG